MCSSQFLCVWPGFSVLSCLLVVVFLKWVVCGSFDHWRHQWYTVRLRWALCMILDRLRPLWSRLLIISLTIPSFSSPDWTLHLISLPLYSTYLQLVLWTAITNHWIKSEFFICLCVLWSLISFTIFCIWFDVLERLVSYALYWFTYCRCLYSMQNIAF